eukprot:1750-Heterococcus_DN1.PRE.3
MQDAELLTSLPDWQGSDRRWPHLAQSQETLLESLPHVLRHAIAVRGLARARRCNYHLTKSWATFHGALRAIAAGDHQYRDSQTFLYKFRKTHALQIEQEQQH